jgi:hypothetical protein
MVAPWPRVGSGEGPTHGALYVVPKIGAPQRPVVAQGYEGLDPATVETSEELQKRFPAQPYDVTWLTAAAIFDLGSVLDEFAGKGQEGATPIPTHWYSGRVSALDVRAEREELVGGKWTNLTLVKPLPGRLTFRDRLSADVTKASVDEMVATVEDEAMQREITCPDFYPTVNESWSIPDPRIDPVDFADLPPEQKEIARLKYERNRLQAERDRLAEQMGELGGTPPDPGEEQRGRERPGDAGKEQPPSAPGGGADRPGGGHQPPGAPGGGGGSGDRRERPPPRPPAGSGGNIGSGVGEGAGGQAAEEKKKRLLVNLEARIRTLDRQIARIDRRLAELGQAAEQLADVADGTIVICAHDLDVVPGRQYRYRFIVDVHNPFYGRKLSLQEAQLSLAEGVTIASATSEWSAAQEMAPDRRFWVVKAFGSESSNPGALGLGHASVEVYRFRDARWWYDDFQLQPGDRIGGQKGIRGGGAAPEAIDFGTSWFVLDVLATPNVDKAESGRGLGATVLVQSLDGRDRIKLDPRSAADDLDRLRLRELADVASAPAEVATGETPPPGDRRGGEGSRPGGAGGS